MWYNVGVRPKKIRQYAGRLVDGAVPKSADGDIVRAHIPLQPPSLRGNPPILRKTSIAYSTKDDNQTQPIGFSLIIN